MAINPVQLVAQQRQTPDFVGQFLRGRQAKQQGELFDMQQQQAEAARRTALDQAETQFFGRAGDLLEGAPPEQQQQAWTQIRQMAIANGIDTEGMPERFTPEMIPIIQQQARLKGYTPPKRDTVLAKPGDTLLDTQTGDTVTSVAPKPDEKDVTSQVNTLRSTINTNLSDFRKVEDSFKRIQSVAKNPSAAGDLALIFNYMKLLDPGSVVRESEFATAQNAAGVPDRVRNTYNRVLSGERLAPEQRADFVGQADNLFTAQRESADQQIANVLEQADQDNIPRTRVLGAERLKSFEQRMLDRQNRQADQTKGRDRSQARRMRDANGNEAFVYPDGTIEEI